MAAANASPEYARRVRQLRGVPKPDLIRRAAHLGHYGVTYGTHGLGGWSVEELRTAILRSEFPPEEQREVTQGPAVTGDTGGNDHAYTYDAVGCRGRLQRFDTTGDAADRGPGGGGGVAVGR